MEFDLCDGNILGIGNGNPNSHHIDTDSKIEFFNSKAQVIVESGKSKLRARCGSMCSEIELEWRKGR